MAIVVPEHVAKAAATWPNGSPYPFNLPSNNVPNMRYQQIYARSAFPRAGKITAIRFRRDEGEPPFMASGIDLTIRLAYAATSVATLSPKFAENIAAGAKTIVGTRGYRLSSLNNHYPEMFDIVFPLETPFVYDPMHGDLLLDVTMKNSILTANFDFARSSDQATTRRVYAVQNTATEGNIDSGLGTLEAGLVTRFDFVPDQNEFSDAALSLPERAKEYLALGKRALAEPLLRQMWEDRSRTSGRADLETIHAESELGTCLAQQGKHSEAEMHLLSGYSLLAERADASVPWLRVYRARLSQLYDDWGNAEEAKAWRSQWADARRQEIAAMPADEAERAGALYRLSLHLMAHQNLADAEVSLRECLELRKRALGPWDRYTCATQSYLGECLHRLGRFEEAESVLLETHATLAAARDQSNSMIAKACERLTNLYRDWGNADATLHWRDLWIQVKHKEIAALPPDSSPQCAVLSRFGMALMNYGLYADAEEVFRQWCAIRLRVLLEHWTVAHAQMCLGGALRAQERHADAEPLLIAAYQRLNAQYDMLAIKDLPRLARQQLIELYETWGRPNEAEKWRNTKSASE